MMMGSHYLFFLVYYIVANVSSAETYDTCLNIRVNINKLLSILKIIIYMSSVYNKSEFLILIFYIQLRILHKNFK